MSTTTATSRLRNQVRRGAALAAVLAAALLITAAGAQAAPGNLEGTTPPLASGTQLFGVAVAPDGTIVAVGQSAGDILVQRFSAAGQANGQYVGPAGVARAVAVEPDGKIVLAGSTGGAMFAERLTPALVPDGSFAGGIAGAFGGSSAGANAVALGPDGTVVIAGGLNSDGQPAVARFTSLGRLDPALGGTGGIALNWGDNSTAEGVAVQPDGRIVLVGRQNPGQPTNGVIARLTTSGSYDPSFAGGSGIFTYHYAGGGYTSLQAVSLQNDGKIIVAGVDSGDSPSCGVCGRSLFLRINADGSYDPSFGSGGIASLPAGGDQVATLGAYGVGIGGGGRIIGAGSYADSATSIDASLWALSPAGASDPAFGPSSVVRGPAGGYESCAVAVAPDGTIVAAGSTITQQPERTPCTVRSTDRGFIARYEGFGPPPPPPPAVTPPTATTATATNVGQSSATLTGQVNPGGVATSYHFDYGTSPAYGSSTPMTSAGGGSAPVAARSLVSGLRAATTYYFRLVATNSAGTTAYGGQATFTTTAPTPVGPPAPSVTTGRVTGITHGSARLTGQVNPNGSVATFHFQLGTSSHYGLSTADRSAGSGSAATSVSATVSRLTAGTRYHYRLVATGPGGTSYGRDATFRTSAPVTFVGLPHAASLRAVRAHGLGVTLSCLQACSAQGKLSVSRSVARALHLAHGATVIANVSGGERRGGRFSVRLRLAASVSSALATAIPVRVSLTFAVRSSHRSFRLAGSLTLTR